MYLQALERIACPLLNITSNLTPMSLSMSLPPTTDSLRIARRKNSWGGAAMKLSMLSILFLAMNALAPVSARVERPHYASAEVMDFTTAPDVTVLSQADISTLATEISEKLKQARMFQQVRVGDDALKTTREPELEIIGEFREFRAGNRSMRYLSAGLAGHTRIKVHVRFVDSASGKTLLEQDLSGTARISSARAAREDIARAITRTVRQNFQ
jgi:hypothetical protein